MLEKLINNNFSYKKLTEAEQKERGILGRLIGPCADFMNPTRNGRKYSEQLWENVFNNNIMQEKIKNKCCFGELKHPADRTEIDPEKAAVCLAETPKRGKDGKLYAVFDIINTPCGRILKAFCDYGTVPGISSRGQGDLITDDDGNEAVDPTTYDCECFDIVLVPGVESARLKYVTESYDNKKKGLKLALKESFDSANENDKKIMQETLNELNINLNESVEKEIKLSDCTKLENAKQAYDLTHKLKAKWCFGAENSFGTNVAEKLFNAYSKEMDWYIHENGSDSIAFGIKENGNVYGPFNINDQPVQCTILVDLNNEKTESKSEEVKEENQEIKESLSINEGEDDFEIDLNDEAADDSEEEVEDANAEETSEDETELDVEEPEDSEEATEDEEEKSDEEIFLDFLANNFDEDKIKEVAKILEIEVLDDDGEPIVNDEEEESTEAEEAPEDIENSDEEAEDKTEENDEEAVDEGFAPLVNSLKEALKGKSDLENNVKSLQEKLAVSDAKVNEITEECNKYKNAVTRLSLLAKSNKDLKESATKLEESLNEKDAIIESQKTRIARLAQVRKDAVLKNSTIDESIKTKDAQITSLNESLNNNKVDYEKQIQSLNEELKKEKSTNETKITKLTESLEKQSALKESYKKLANTAVNKYIEVKADILGITPKDIKRKLGESYSMEDVDQVCEELKSYQLNVSKLPFSIDKRVSVKVNESVNKLNKYTSNAVSDDDVDDSLIRLANSYK